MSGYNPESPFEMGIPDGHNVRWWIVGGWEDVPCAVCGRWIEQDDIAFSSDGGPAACSRAHAVAARRTDGAA